MTGTCGIKTRIVRTVALVEHREQHPTFWTISVADMPRRYVINHTIYRCLRVDVDYGQARPRVRTSIQRRLWPGCMDDHFASLEIDPHVGVRGAVEDVPIKSSVSVINFQALTRGRPVTGPSHQHLAGWENLDFVPAGGAILRANHKTLRDDSIRAEVIENAHREPAARRRPDQPVFAPVIG